MRLFQDKKRRIARALDLCESFQGSSIVLQTKTQEGLNAVQAAGIEAVVWPRQHQKTTPVMRKIDRFLNDESGLAHEWRRHISIDGGFLIPSVFSSPIKNTLQKNNCFYDEDFDGAMSSLGRLMARSSGLRKSDLFAWLKLDHWKNHNDLHEILDDPHYKDGLKLHVDDNLIYSLYKNSRYAGMDMVLAEVSESQRHRLYEATPQERAGLREDFNIVQAGAGDAVIFAGGRAAERDSTKKGLIHGTCLPVPGTVRRGLFVDTGRLDINNYTF